MMFVNKLIYIVFVFYYCYKFNFNCALVDMDCPSNKMVGCVHDAVVGGENVLDKPVKLPP